MLTLCVYKVIKGAVEWFHVQGLEDDNCIHGMLHNGLIKLLWYHPVIVIIIFQADLCYVHCLMCSVFSSSDHGLAREDTKTQH